MGIAGKMREANELLDRLYPHNPGDCPSWITNRPTVDNPHGPIQLREIFDIVCKRFDISRADMESPRRARPIAHARQMYCLLARELTDKSTNQIALVIGGRDHTTVLYAVKAARERVAAEPEYGDQYARCIRELGRLV